MGGSWYFAVPEGTAISIGATSPAPDLIGVALILAVTIIASVLITAVVVGVSLRRVETAINANTMALYAGDDEGDPEPDEPEDCPEPVTATNVVAIGKSVA